jgi:hypothetical protein
MSNIKQIREILYGEEYEKDGEKKTKWNRCGTMFINENGNIGIKLTAMPLGTQNLMAFPPKPKDQPVQKEAPVEQKEEPQVSDLPF